MANTTDKSILTAAGKALLAQLNAEEKPLIIDKMIFANVPNRPEFPQPDDVVPTDHVVHQEGVEQRGRLSADSVIYSTTLTSDVGPFEFNWTGAYCSEYGVLVTIDHHALTPKTADEPGVSGNTLVRSVVLEYKDIAEITNITVDASTWQYNANERMKKMDTDVAQAIIDQNGKDWFIEDGFLVTPQSTSFNIKAGAGYVSGNRVMLEFDRSVQVPNKPSFIYVDARREGTPTGEQVTLFDFVVTAEEKDDYTDEQGVKHFVCKIAQVLTDGSVSDLRSEGESATKNWVGDRLNKEVIDDDDPDVVPLPIRSRFRRYDVREYGAVAGQDIVEILKKIRAKIKDGDTIYIPETYYCSEPIYFSKAIQARKRFSVIGGGQILMPEGKYFQQVVFDPGDEEFERIIWENVDLLCPHVDFPWHHEVDGQKLGEMVRGISAYRVNEFELLNTHFENQSFVAAAFHGCNDVEVSENRLKNIGGNGFSTDKDNFGNRTNGFTAVRNRMKGVYDSFYGTHHCNDVLISLNKLYKHGSKAWMDGKSGYGIDLAGTSDARVSENQIYGTVHEDNPFSALAIHVHSYLGSVARHVRLSGNEIFGTNGVKVDEGATDVRSMAEYIKGALNGYLIADATDVRMAETEIIDCLRKGVSDGDYGLVKDGRDFRDLTISGCDWGMTLKEEHRDTKVRTSKIFGNRTGDLYLPSNLDKSVTIYDIETSNSDRSDASVVPVGPFDTRFTSFTAEQWTKIMKVKDSKFTYQVNIVSTGANHYQGTFFVAGTVGADVNVSEVVKGGFGVTAELRLEGDELQIKFSHDIANTRIRVNEFFRD